MPFYKIDTPTKRMIIPTNKCWIERRGDDISIYISGDTGGPLSAHPGEIELVEDDKLLDAVKAINKP